MSERAPTTAARQPVYTLRPATHADAEFACAVKLHGLRPYVEALTSSWDEARHRASFHAHYDPERTQIVLADGEEIGVLRVEQRPTEVVLAEIYLGAAARNRGIGSAVVRDVVAAAHAQGRKVTLQLLRPNPVRQLYERLGFRVVGETVTHFRMECACPDEPA